MTRTDPLLIYGAYGYTGDLVVREAVRKGLRPILAGRDSRALAAVAAREGLEHRAVGLDDAGALDTALDGVVAVLHCAGPFVHTAGPMVDACLRNRVNYLDVTGEIAVFEQIATRNDEAKARRVTLLPGVGFDVVPSDCLAAHLARRLPTASELALAFRTSGGVSRGTATTMAENVGSGGAVRRGGKIVGVRAAWHTREIDFGDGKNLAVTIPWGDVSTAWYSTGIPDIRVYMAMPQALRRSLVVSRYIGWLLSWGPIRRRIVARAKARDAGPSAESRARGESTLWGEVRDATGNVAVSTLRGPEGYTLTAMTAVAAAQRIMAGGVPPGFQTPSLAFGADFILEQPGVVRADVR